jgi:hypothetical protein
MSTRPFNIIINWERPAGLVEQEVPYGQIGSIQTCGTGVSTEMKHTHFNHQAGATAGGDSGGIS